MCEEQIMNEMIFYNQKKDINFSCSVIDPSRAIPNKTTALETENFHIEFDKDVSETDKWDYIISCASGVIASAIHILWVGEFSLTDAKSWGTEKTNDFVLKVAKSCGYKGNDLGDAIRKLEKDFIIPSDKLTPDFGGGKQHHLRDFGHHASPLGLIFSILTQFTGMGYGTDTAGIFHSIPLPKDAVIGANFSQKIYNGVITWIFHLISDMAGSNKTAGKGTGIPGPLLSLLKEMSAMPLFKDLKIKYKDDDIGFSVFVSKLFNGTYFKDIPFDLRTEIGIAHELSRQTIPIIINECIFRCFYAIRRLFLEIKEKNIQSIDMLNTIEWKRVLPFNNRTVIRMATISSGTFLAITTSKAGVQAIIKSGGVNANSTKDFLLNLNYFGVGRFVIACVADGKYIVEDVKDLCKEITNRYELDSPYFAELDHFSLNYIETQILHSLQYHKVLYDINNSKKHVDKKKTWLEKWKQITLSAQNIENEDYFIEDETVLYNYINEQCNNKNTNWLHLIALELICFVPYTQLSEDDTTHKGISIKDKTGYEYKVFAESQSILSLDEIKKIEKRYNHFINCMTGLKEKIAIGITTTAVVTIATGGFALAFAPKIAVMIAGSSFVGLHGAALTSASLAAIGFGSLAAGGLGMAGGTAIIAGGGVLLGLGVTGTGFASVSTISVLSSKGFVLHECAKLLTFCDVVIKKAEDYISIFESYNNSIKKSIDDCQKEIENLKENPTKNSKNQIKNSNKSIKHLKKCSKQLSKMIK